MLRNYITVAVRYLVRHRGYTAINVIGLGCAMACAILVSAYVAEEFRYVDYHENGHRIYRVLKEVRHETGASFVDWVSGGATVAMREMFPEIEASGRATASQHTRSSFLVEGRTLQNFFCRADPAFLDVFGFEIVRGVLSADVMTAVVTESAAQQFFGDADPIGKVITVLGSGPAGEYTVTGVLEDVPKYAFIRLGVVTTAPSTAFVNEEREGWEGWSDPLWGPKNYVRLPEGFPPDRVERSLNEVMSRSISPEAAAKTTLHLQPIDEARLYGSLRPGTGTMPRIQRYTMITLILAAVACANFVNLAVARTVARTGQVAARKAIGARRRDIVLQFLAESMLICLVALVFGLAIAQHLPVEGYLSQALKATDALNVYFLSGLLVTLVVIALAAGVYPGVLASRVSLRDSGRSTGMSVGGAAIRNFLVIGQLACAAFFIASVLIVEAQNDRMKSADVGFDKDQVLTTRYIFNDSTLAPRRDAMKAAFMRLPGVVAAATTWPGPGMESVTWTARPGDDLSTYDVRILGVDEDFLETYGVRLASGRNVGPRFAEKEAAEFVVNEEAVRRFGWKDGAVGKSLTVGEYRGVVVGVVEDFHYSALRDPIPPLVMLNWERLALALRIETDDVEGTMADIETTWKSFSDRPQPFTFVDQRWGWSYYQENQRQRAYALLSWTAILLAGLGVLGLAAYEAEQRRREIGVRKVLGATLSSIVRLFWYGHARLVILANLVALPLAWWFTHAWLEGYAYRIEPGVLPFATAGAVVGAMFLVLVGIQAVRIGQVDPAETLRRE